VDNKSGNNTGQIYTTVRAPQLVYRDDVRIATYTEGVKLVRDKMTITSRELRAYLSPKSTQASTHANTQGSQQGNQDSSLDHAIATGDVKISDVIAPGRTRTGTGERCEYYTKEDKVVLNGGAPQMVDSTKGTIKGQQLTYFSGEDRLIVDGKKEQVAFTRMKKK
jgi:lipopolysaccharide transport protein LptA